MTVAFQQENWVSNNSGTTAVVGALYVSVGTLMIASVVARGCTNLTPTCTDDNQGIGAPVTWTLVFAELFNIGADMHCIFIRDKIQSGADVSPITTVVLGAHDSVQVHVGSFSGMLRHGGESPVRSIGYETGASGTPAPALNQACLTGNYTYGSTGYARVSTNSGTPTSWTNIRSINAYSAIGLHVVGRDSGFTGTTAMALRSISWMAAF